MNVDSDRVIVAGMGPVGMVAALALAREGVAVTVLEAGDTLADESRASTFHPPTLELLDSLGVIEELMNRGIAAPVFQQRDRSIGVLAEFDLSILSDETAYPFRIQSEQNNLTEIIYDVLKKMSNVELRFSFEVDRVENTSNGVLVGSKDNDDAIYGRWLIAADGAHSRIRHCLGVAFEGITYPEQFLVVSTDNDWTLDIPDLASVAYVSDPEEWVVLLRTPRHWRVLFPIRNGLDSKKLELVEIQRMLKGIASADHDYKIVHTTLYNVHQRVAASFSAGRVLLAGDAAHVNNPLGGMGMNSGIHDAVGAAESVLAELNGAPAERCASLYSTIRREAALSYVQAETHRNFSELSEQGSQERQRRAMELKALVDDPDRLRSHLRRTSMLMSARRTLSQLKTGLEAARRSPQEWEMARIPITGNNMKYVSASEAISGDVVGVVLSDYSAGVAEAARAVEELEIRGVRVVVEINEYVTEGIVELVRKLERAGAVAVVVDGTSGLGGDQESLCSFVAEALSARQRMLIALRVDIVGEGNLLSARRCAEMGIDYAVVANNVDEAIIEQLSNELVGVKCFLESGRKKVVENYSG